MKKKKTSSRKSKAIKIRLPRKARPVIDGIIFDIDNVLIDTRKSYTNAIRWTIELYLTTGSIPFYTLQQKKRNPQLLTAEDVDQFKLLGGFNDDWDCCYGFLLYILSLQPQGRTIHDLRKVINIRELADKFKRRPVRVSGIVRAVGQNRAVKIEKISRMFQEIYLGRDLFEIVEKRRAIYWKKFGLIHKEKPIFRKSTLKKLKDRGFKLGIATGRPRFEAIYALKRFGILEYFDAITTMNEVKKAERQAKRSLRKPHPYSVLETAKKLGANKRFLYVGDLPDDILAAREAGQTIQIRSVGFPKFASNPAVALQELRKAKPDFLIEKPSDLMTLVKLGKSE